MAYGAIIPELQIDGRPAPYGVVNERAVRATAGIMFLVGITTFVLIRTTGSSAPLAVTVPLFWMDFLLRVVLGPERSMFAVAGAWMVRNQKPEWVGAVQKRFAWSIGLAFASVMIVLALFMGVRGWIPLSICMVCLAFLWLESSAGICVGCSVYSWLLRNKWLPEPAVRPACPGGVCALR